jgi:hypothetical protein
MSAEAAGSVEAGVGAVGVDADLDPRLDEVGPHWAFGDLQFQRPVGHAIVVHDLTLLLHAQDLIEIDARNGREGRAFAGRIDGEAGVVGGQKDLVDESVGRLGRGIPASLIPGSSRGRSCNVWKARSERPLAKGVRKEPVSSTGYAVRKPR